MNIDLKRELARIKNKIDEEIIKFSTSLEAPSELVKASFHLIKSGGKRIRPFLLIKSTELMGGSEEDALPAAVAIELLHNFTLIHDDIMDRDEFRRGVKTTHVVFGEPLAIIAGDFLFSNVFTILANSYDSVTACKLIKIFSDASNLICMGQTMDILPDKYILTNEDYFRMVYWKTGALIEAACKSGGVIAGATDREIEILSMFGRKAGIAFQIADDLLGVIGDPAITGKPVGSDIRNGKKTLLVLYTLNKLSNSDREYFLKVFGNENASDEDIKRVIKLMEETGVFEYAREYMENLIKEAISYLRKLPPNEARDYLEEMAKYIIYRSK